MKSNGEHDWNFSQIGGVSRVNITSGSDIAHLDELDRKLWTVLSCPAEGLELEQKSLSMVDEDGDGVIRVDDVLSAARWLTDVTDDPDTIVGGKDILPLSAINQRSAEGKSVYDAASLILTRNASGREHLSPADVSSFIDGFSKNPFNGDGVITQASVPQGPLSLTFRDIVSTMGGVRDAGGEDGADAASVRGFYAALREYTAWIDAGKTASEGVFPFGEDTGVALDAVLAIKDKVEDYFLRCSLAAFDAPSAPALDVSVESIRAISGKDLTRCTDEIASYPISKVDAGGRLNLTCGINPVWRDAVSAFREKVAEKILPKAESMDEKEWKDILSRFDAFVAWQNASHGGAVAGLGYDRAAEILREDGEAELLSLIERDLTFRGEVENFRKVEKMAYLYRDFIHLLNNFVTFRDFYSPSDGLKADFQAGTLYIDQRSCDLCIKVTDMASHNAMAPLSGMFLLYCKCVSRKNASSMTIAAAVTDGDIANLREGKNAIFYDRAGEVWDAGVIKVVDNPIGIRQAFWSPYRKLGAFVASSLGKMASDREAKVLEKGKADISKAGGSIAAAPTSETSAQPTGGSAEGKHSFDIAKFAGLFAMVSMALTTIMGFFLNVFEDIVALKWWQVILVIAALMLLISGPSMFKAWLTLRKRNITPLLNANGWAINSKVLVNSRFGATLTSMARMPLIPIGEDPFAGKKMPSWKKALIWVLAVLLLAVAAVVVLKLLGITIW